MLGVTKKVAGFSGNFFVKQQRDLGKVNGFIEEMMDGQKVVKVFCHEEENIEKFKEINNNLYESAYNANAFANVIGPINAQLGNMSYVVCAIVGGALALGSVGGFTPVSYTHLAGDTRHAVRTAYRTGPVASSFCD